MLFWPSADAVWKSSHVSLQGRAEMFETHYGHEDSIFDFNIGDTIFGLD